MCAVSASCHFRDDDYVTCMDHSPVHSALDLRLIKMNFSLHCWLRHMFTKCPRSLHQSCLWSWVSDLNYPLKHLCIFWHYSAISDISVPADSFENNTMFFTSGTVRPLELQPSLPLADQTTRPLNLPEESSVARTACHPFGVHNIPQIDLSV